MRRNGFTLLEMAVVLTIVAMVVASSLTLGTIDTQQKRSVSTYDEIEELGDALSVFLAENGRLPCPADITLTIGDGEFGREASDCSDATPPAGIIRVQYPVASGKYVRIGGVPFYSLEMPITYLDDEWGGRYLYAVSEDAITGLSDGDEGNITVQDRLNDPITDTAVWVLVSHGPTREGAYAALTGSLIAACNGNKKDEDNCDGDGIFNDTELNFKMFDDLILWKERADILASGGAGRFEPWKQGQAADGDASGYALEVKGVTSTTFNAGQGVGTYNAQCDSDYPGSWVLRSSDLDYIEDLPLIPTASRFIVDTCDHHEETNNTCFLTFPRSTGTMTALTGSNSFETITRLNCNGWSQATASGTTKSLTLQRTSTVINFRDINEADATGMTVAISGCNALTTFICVGEK